MSKYHHTLLTLLFITSYATQCSHAMKYKEKKPLNCNREITSNNAPHKALYITQKSILIESWSDKFKYFHIMDLNTQNTQLLKQSSYVPRSLVHGKKILLYCHPHLTAYNTEKNIEEWSWKQPTDTSMLSWNYASALAWNIRKDTVFLCHGNIECPLTQYNYRTNTMTKIPIQHSCHIMAIHPKKDIMCLADSHTNLHLYHINDLKKFKKISLKDIKMNIFCRYSSDGSYIIAGDKHKIYIIGPNINGNKYPCIQSQPNEIFQAIATHPTMPILAILCKIMHQKQSAIHYFNINTQKSIEISHKIIATDCHSLDFSPEGFKIIATVEDKHVELPVSFLHKMREKYLFPLFVLKHINDRNKGDHLPQDVTRYCAQMLLNSFEI